ncbi:MAG: hypothetical protein WC848_02665 [Parcubacteria group bacterium]
MKRVLFFSGSYAAYNVKRIAGLIERLGYETIILSGSDELEGFPLTEVSVVVIEECSCSSIGKELAEFLKKHPIVPMVRGGCSVPMCGEFEWGKDDLKIFVKILSELGEKEDIIKFFSRGEEEK